MITYFKKISIKAITLKAANYNSNIHKLKK